MAISQRIIRIDKSSKIYFTHFKSCDNTLGKFQYHSNFRIHGTTFQGMKYVGEIKRCFIKRLIT